MVNPFQHHNVRVNNFSLVFEPCKDSNVFLYPVSTVWTLYSLYLYFIGLIVKIISKIQQRKLVLKTNRETGEQNGFLSDELERWLFNDLLVFFVEPVCGGIQFWFTNGPLVFFSVFCLNLINRAKPPPPPPPGAAPTTTDALYSDCEFCIWLSSQPVLCEVTPVSLERQDLGWNIQAGSCLLLLWKVLSNILQTLKHVIQSILAISQLVCLWLNFQNIIL